MTEPKPFLVELVGGPLDGHQEHVWRIETRLSFGRVPPLDHANATEDTPIQYTPLVEHVYCLRPRSAADRSEPWFYYYHETR